MKNNYTKNNHCMDCGKLIDNRAKRCRECYYKFIKKEKNYCIDCNKEISKWGIRCNSCEGKRRFKLGILNKDGKNNPRYNKKIHKKYYCKCGNEIDFRTALYGKGQCQECRYKSMKGKHPWNYLGYHNLPKCVDCGKELKDYRSIRCKQCASKKFKSKRVRLSLKALKFTPNKPERKLNKLLNKWLNKEYKFVGDGKIVFGGFCPDFINCNGQKKIIELFGCYWHNLPKIKKRDRMRLGWYRKYGYKTLIIWEHELKSLNRLKTKILNFHNDSY